MIVTDMPVERLIPYARNPRNNTAAIDVVNARNREIASIDCHCGVGALS
jgi:hypothetical protein